MDARALKEKGTDNSIIIINNTKPVPCKLTPSRRAILEYLAVWRFATTTHIHQELQSDKMREHTFGELRCLRQAGLVRSFAIYSERGSNSEQCWLLGRSGAKAIDHKYGSHYERHPSRARITLRDMELELIRQVEFAGWELLRPVPYSPSLRLPETGTPQYQRLVEVIDASESNRIKTAIKAGYLKADSQIIKDFEQGTYHWSLPRRCNDYLAIWASTSSDQRQDKMGNFPSPPLATIIILCPPEVADRFWQSRLEQYASLSKYNNIALWGVFQTEEHRRAGEEMLKRLIETARYSKWRASICINNADTDANAEVVWIKTAVVQQVYRLLESYRAMTRAETK